MERFFNEYENAAGVTMKVDRQAAVIRGVKLLGLVSRNQRIYLPEALERAIPLYENAKVNVNHPKGHPAEGRDYQDRIGIVRGVRFETQRGLFADLHYNPKHALAEQLLWDAEHLPENVGFSHNVRARVAQRDRQTIVEAIVHVQSVDLVADPATTRGLFESAGRRPLRCQGTSGDGGDLRGTAVAAVDRVLGEDLRPELSGANSPTGGAAGLEPDAACPCRRWQERICELEAQLADMAVVASRAERTILIWRTLTEFGLPLPDGRSEATSELLGRDFLELLKQVDEPTVRRLIADRAKLAAGAVSGREVPGEPRRPQSRNLWEIVGQSPGGVAEFVRAIRRES